MTEVEVLISTVRKNGVDIKIPKTSFAYNWFGNEYPYWESETFDTIDKYANPDKKFLDIGCWNGATSLYAGQKFSEVVCIDADKESIKEVEENLKLNNIKHVLYYGAIYNEKKMVRFGTNQFHHHWNFLNCSTSQIQKEGLPSWTSYEVETITLNEIFEKNPLSEFGLVKIDIEGGEENILPELIEIAQQAPIMLSFHFTWWEVGRNSKLKKFSNLVKDLKITDYFGQPVRSVQDYITGFEMGSLVIEPK